MEFVRQAWAVLEPATVYRHNWHIDAIADHLTAVSAGEIKNLVINIPPGCMKSLLTSVIWPAWDWAADPWRKFLCSSYAGSLALRDSLKMRRLLESDWYKANYGQAFRLVRDQNAKGRFENTAGGGRIATSTGGATGERGDIRINDDPHNMQNVQSDTIRDGDVEWWKTVWQSRANDATDARRSAQVIIMQRLHQADISGVAGDVLGDFEHLVLPMRFEPARKCKTSIFEDPRTEAGELLDPDRFPDEEVDRLSRALGQYGAAGQLQQRPAPAEGGIIKAEWLKTWHWWPKGWAFDEMIQSWDMAFKKTKTGSYVVGQVWGRKGANKYLIHQVRRRMSFTETLAAVRQMSKDYPKARAKLVEDKANGPAIMDTLKAEIPGLIPVQADTSKEARLHAVAPDIEAGNVYIPSPERCSWVSSYLDELINFPNAAEDDQVDTTTQALERLTKTRRTGAFKIKGA